MSMKTKDCTNCKYSEFQKDKIGRRFLESPGKCNYPEIILPNCYIDRIGDRRDESPIYPKRCWITKYTRPDCPCWGKI